MSEVKTYDLYGEEGIAIIEGTYRRFDTCLWPFVREHDVDKGTFTAQQVADFINPKMNPPRFGFVFVKDGGRTIRWYDDQPFDVQIEFKREDKKNENYIPPKTKDNFTRCPQCNSRMWLHLCSDGHHKYHCRNCGKDIPFS